MKLVTSTTIQGDKGLIITASINAARTIKVKQIAAAIRNRVENSVYSLINNLDTPFNIIESFKDSFEQYAQTIIANTMAQMYQLKCHSGYYILKHMNKLTKSYTRLAKLETTLTDSVDCNIIISSLPNRYKQIVLGMQTLHKVAQDAAVSVATATTANYTRIKLKAQDLIKAIQAKAQLDM